MKVLKYPYPYKAWLTISNDPDNTDIAVWKELDDYLFNELNLDWANSVFLFNFNQNLPEQVSVKSHPEISDQSIDTLHTWGDFVHAGEKGFTRNDAKEGLALLEKKGINPLVWVDHSRFTGNLIHENTWGGIPEHVDSSGNTYKVFEYSLDLIKKAGIRYAWNGNVTNVIGQDRIVKLNQLLKPYKAPIKATLLLNKAVGMSVEEYLDTDNNAYKRKRFKDGNELYCFKRFGEWKNADIDGLSETLSRSNIDELIKNQGVMIAYTHLGKRNASSPPRDHHIPESTKARLKDIVKKQKAGVLNFSSVSKLLDYLILRDHIKLSGNSVDFQSDGLRFSNLKRSDLKGQSFSFKGTSKPFILLDGQSCSDYELIETNEIITVRF
ncbi:MAG: hypothetical protein N4A46_09065 [Schleiferiaceae bacterium]|jgi:hypothetical protein|nr:hypothetical protein [Schleiferiaceae bacterium]